jgi:hypothetical protein
MVSGPLRASCRQAPKSSSPSLPTVRQWSGASGRGCRPPGTKCVAAVTRHSGPNCEGSSCSATGGPLVDRLDTDGAEGLTP